MAAALSLRADNMASKKEASSLASVTDLAAHCAAQCRATGLSHAVLPAVTTGNSHEVWLEGGLAGFTPPHPNRALAARPNKMGS